MPDPSPNHQSEPEWEPEASPKDPRNAQFSEVALMCFLLLVAHGIAMAIGVYSQTVGWGTYLMITGICFPLIVLILSVNFWVEGRWHWGQVVLAMLVALVLSFFQLMWIGCESGSV